MGENSHGKYSLGVKFWIKNIHVLHVKEVQLHSILLLRNFRRKNISSSSTLMSTKATGALSQAYEQSGNPRLLIECWYHNYWNFSLFWSHFSEQEVLESFTDTATPKQIYSEYRGTAVLQHVCSCWSISKYCLILNKFLNHAEWKENIYFKIFLSQLVCAGKSIATISVALPWCTV